MRWQLARILLLVVFTYRPYNENQAENDSNGEDDGGSRIACKRRRSLLQLHCRRRDRLSGGQPNQWQAEETQ